MSSPIGRRSPFAKEQQSLALKQSAPNFESSFKALIVDVCNASKPETIFLNKTFPNGVTLIVIPFQKCEAYAVKWKDGEANLRSLEGTDENIVGREITVTVTERESLKILNGKVKLDGDRVRKIQDASIPGYRSLSFFGGMYTDYESQMKNNKNSSGGPGEINVSFEKG